MTEAFETEPLVLTREVLAEMRQRAPRYDRENSFFTEDLADLKRVGYLAAPVPAELGGGGLSLEQLLVEQRRLAAHAPATALGVNMHLVWVQVAKHLCDRGVNELDWVLRDAAAGEVFAFGISEPANDAVLLDSFSVATEQENGDVLISGTKIFTTLSPVWTRLGVHAKQQVDGGEPQLVYGFIRREGGVLAEGTIEHPGTWNPLGMRATQSYTTVLRDVSMRAGDIAARFAPYDGSDPLVLAIFASFSLLTAAVYAGIADRALELASESTQRIAKRPDGSDGTRLDDPDTASRLTSALLEHRTSVDTLTLLARDVDELRPRSDWFVALAACRNLVTDEARGAVDQAMRLVGASGYQTESELARLYRDVLAGLFHPSSSRSLAASVRGSISS